MYILTKHFSKKEKIETAFQHFKKKKKKQEKPRVIIASAPNVPLRLFVLCPQALQQPVSHFDAVSSGRTDRDEEG